MDVLTEGGMIEPGANVEVIVVDGTKIVVRKV
jgi:membrane protein implicated in regulation of membrane protease activity